MKSGPKSRRVRLPICGMCEFPKRGEVYLVQLPNQPHDGKERPALVISLDIRNRLANDVIVVPITTNLRPAPTHVLLQEGEGGLRHNSIAKCEQVTTLDKSLLVRGPFGGRISHEHLNDIERGIMRAIGCI